MRKRVSMILLTLTMVLAVATAALAQDEALLGEGLPITTPQETTSAGPEVVAAPAASVTIVNSLGDRVVVPVEIADVAAERQEGLMGETALATGSGMLFVFESEQPLSFWMKDTLIPLSIAFIDAQGRIVDIQDMQPLDETSHISAAPAQYALEVNQGFFAERGIQVGDLVELPVLQPAVGTGEVLQPPDPALVPSEPVAQEALATEIPAATNSGL